MTNDKQERREFTRIMFDAHTSMTQGDKHWDVELVDLSLNGLLINEPPNWQIDTNRKLIATIVLDKEISIEMAVHQRHVKDGRIGFKCDQMDIDSISHLRRLVELNLGDLALLERELEALQR